jgi:uncharacterized protein (TIGR02246 family)
MRAVVFLLSVSLLTVMSSSSSAQSGDVRSAIEAVNVKFGAAWGKKDAAALAALYTANATVMAPNGAPVAGSQAILEFWKAGLAVLPPVGKLTTAEVEAHGDTAHEVGTYELSAADGKVIDKGKYIVIWKREGGQWKMHRDIWNSDLPAAAPL